MKGFKYILLASAAAMLIGSGDAEAAHLQFFAGTSPTLCMPQRTVAAGQALSPYAVATRLSARRYKVQSMHRHGSAYAVRAIGPHGNKVDMMVDGGSGTIIGLTVLAAAAGNIISAMTAQNAVYVDDLHPFGAVVPEVVYDFWDNIGESSWQVASAGTVSVTESYAAYQAAVPFNFVHMARNGRSVALAPPRYRGFRLTNSRGQAIYSRMTRSEAASQEAAYQSERVDQAEFDKQMAQEDAADANEHADQLQQQNDALSDQLDAQTQHADEVEQKNAELQQQLDQNGTGNQEVDDADVTGGDNDCGPSESTCNGKPNDNYDASDSGGAAADSTDTLRPDGRGAGRLWRRSCAPSAVRQCDAGRQWRRAGGGRPTPRPHRPTIGGDSNVDRNYSTGGDQGGAETNTAEDRVPAGGNADNATPADQGGADQGGAAPSGNGDDQQTATPADQGGDQQPQQATPQDQGGNDQQQTDQGGGGDQQQSAPDDFGGNDMGGGGGDDSGGGGGDDGGGGGDE